MAMSAVGTTTAITIEAEEGEYMPEWLGHGQLSNALPGMKRSQGGGHTTGDYMLTAAPQISSSFAVMRNNSHASKPDSPKRRNLQECWHAAKHAIG